VPSPYPAATSVQPTLDQKAELERIKREADEIQKKVTTLQAQTVKNVFNEVLKRDPTQPELDQYVGQLQKGVNVQQIRAALLSSPEYKQRSGSPQPTQPPTVVPQPTVQVNPHVLVSPPSGPRGTTFSQPGQGFTPNSTVTLHFRKPDGTQYPPVKKTTDVQGRVNNVWTAPPEALAGMYQYWAVDDRTGKQSNVVAFTVTVPSTAVGPKPTQPLSSQPKPVAGQYQDTVRRAYLDILKREPDPGGVKYYTELLQKGQLNEASLRATLLNSAEYKQRFGR